MSQVNRSQWLWPLIAVVSIAIAFASLSIRTAQDHALESNKPKNLELVHAMRLNLLAVSEAQNIAMIAKSEKLSGECLEQADAGVQGFQRAYSELKSNPPAYIDSMLIARVGDQFDAFYQVHNQLTSMLQRNTNRKAYELATGSGLKLLNEIDAGLHSLTESVLESHSSNQLADVKQMYEIRLSLLRIQNMLIPHISEPSDSEMDNLESRMRTEELVVEKGIQQLSTREGNKDKLSEVNAQLADFQKLKAQIITLSRENSNVHSETLAVNERRDLFLACEATLVDLVNQINSHDPPTIIPKGR